MIVWGQQFWIWGGRKTIFKAGGARVKSHRAINNGQMLPGQGKSKVSKFIESASCQCQGVCKEILVFFLSLLLLSLSTKQHFAKKSSFLLEKVVNNTIQNYLPPNFFTLSPILTLLSGLGRACIPASW